jgi:hypothetical protein
MNIQMHPNQSTNDPRESAAHSAPTMSTQRQRLRAIVDRNADLFDPPNTAEAFARLEVAMDEAKQQSSSNSEIAGQNDTLDPPNTAERFARIEAAMDAVFAKSVSAAWTRRHQKKSKFETRVPIRDLGLRSTQDMHFRKAQPLRSSSSGASTQSQAQVYSDSNFKDDDRLIARNLLERAVHDGDRLVNDSGDTAKDAHVFAGTDTTNHSKHESRDTDIFRSSVAMDEFANKAYQSAREKYL